LPQKLLFFAGEVELTSLRCFYDFLCLLGGGGGLFFLLKLFFALLCFASITDLYFVESFLSQSDPEAVGCHIWIQ
jgi:hypothetical protein